MKQALEALKRHEENMEKRARRRSSARSNARNYSILITGPTDCNQICVVDERAKYWIIQPQKIKTNLVGINPANERT